MIPRLIHSPRLPLALSTGLMALCWYFALIVAPTEAAMGEIYRIIYLHVPSAFAAFLAAFGLFVTSLLALRNRPAHMDLFAQACAEVGLGFTVLTLATGSIWGKPTWGTWWTWDARLTTTLILGLMLLGYLVLERNIHRPDTRRKVCAVLGILIFVDVPIIYKSVTWWRTLHQPPSMLREGGASMSPEILSTLLGCLAATALVGVLLALYRARNLILWRKILDEIEEA